MDIFNSFELINSFSSFDNDDDEVSIEIIKNDDLFIALMDAMMNTDELKLFRESFQMYLQYGNSPAYVVDFDNIWPAIGLASKGNGKRILASHGFKLNVDFIEFDVLPINGIKTVGTQLKKILMKVESFKLFCMACNTKESFTVVKMESVQLEYFRRKRFLKNAERNLEIQRAFRWIKHESLIERHRFMNLVYVLLLECFENGGVIIKLGNTFNDLVERKMVHHPSTDVKQLFLTCSHASIVLRSNRKY